VRVKNYEIIIHFCGQFRRFVLHKYAVFLEFYSLNFSSSAWYRRFFLCSAWCRLFFHPLHGTDYPFILCMIPAICILIQQTIFFILYVAQTILSSSAWCRLFFHPPHGKGYLFILFMVPTICLSSAWYRLPVFSSNRQFFHPLHGTDYPFIFCMVQTFLSSSPWYRLFFLPVHGTD